MISEKIDEESYANFSDKFESNMGLVAPFSNMQQSQGNTSPPPIISNTNAQILPNQIPQQQKPHGNKLSKVPHLSMEIT
jgi:hypothetical protein